MVLDSQQVKQIADYVCNNGLTIAEVQEDVIDHLCCLTEQRMAEGTDFDTAFAGARLAISPEDLREIDETTFYFLTIKNRILMIRAMFITAYTSIALYLLGQFFGTYGFVLQLPDIIGFALVMGGVVIFVFAFLPLLFLYGYQKFVEKVKG